MNLEKSNDVADPDLKSLTPEVTKPIPYLLATCHKFNNDFLSAMLKTHKNVATRHYFNFIIKLNEPDENTFAIDNVSCTFADMNDPCIYEYLQLFNDTILLWEMPQIYKNVQNQLKNIKLFDLIGVYTIAALIKYYSKSSKYVYIPITLDYGRNNNMHQAALIIDLTGKFLFYEPYGLYTKYGKSYKNIICNFFKVFENCNLCNKLPSESDVFTTYHDFLDLEIGIQTMIMIKNNDQINNFQIEYKDVCDNIIKEFPNYSIIPIDITDFKGIDKTIHIINLLSNLYDLPINSNDKKYPIYLKILSDTLNIYNKYNSQTCVSITIIELNEFFKLADLSYTDKRTKLINLYNEFGIESPNTILFKKINDFANTLLK